MKIMVSCSPTYREMHTQSHATHASAARKASSRNISCKSACSNMQSEKCKKQAHKSRACLNLGVVASGYVRESEPLCVPVR